MSTKEKLIERFKNHPKDFTWDELVRLFGFFGFVLDNKGKTSGSRSRFKNNDNTYYVHKPHPANIIKKSALNDAFNYLKNNGLLD